MAQYAAQPDNVEAISRTFASPVPLGLSAFACATAVLGCVYAGFIVPLVGAGAPLLAAVLIFWGGIVQILAGMWEFRKDNTIAATLFTTYGGFMLAFGIILLPGLGILPALASTGAINQSLGVLFLVWTIFAILFVLGSLRTNMAWFATVFLMAWAFIFLTAGFLAGPPNHVLVVIGGWVAIASALAAWYAMLASLLHTANGTFHLPMGWIAPNSPIHQ
jgi:succinate-acetate transporter protein